MLVDTHAHLWWSSFDKDELVEVLMRAKKAGVVKIIVPGINFESSLESVELAKKYPGIVCASVGIHPEETINVDFDFDIYSFKKIINENIDEVKAIGEIGIDLYTEESKVTLKAQVELFKLQLELACDMDLPVIIHTRNSFDEVWNVLKSLPKMPRGQFHCFSIDEVALSMVLTAGFYVSFGGNITWSKRVERLVSMVPNNRLLLETDSPLMVPRDSKGVPVNGNDRNEPANVRILAEKIAELRGVKTTEIEKITTINANELYKL